MSGPGRGLSACKKLPRKTPTTDDLYPAQRRSVSDLQSILSVAPTQRRSVSDLHNILPAAPTLRRSISDLQDVISRSQHSPTRDHGAAYRTTVTNALDDSWEDTDSFSSSILESPILTDFRTRDNNKASDLSGTVSTASSGKQTVASYVQDNAHESVVGSSRDYSKGDNIISTSTQTEVTTDTEPCGSGSAGVACQHTHHHVHHHYGGPNPNPVDRASVKAPDVPRRVSSLSSGGRSSSQRKRVQFANPVISREELAISDYDRSAYAPNFEPMYSDDEDENDAEYDAKYGAEDSDILEERIHFAAYGPRPGTPMPWDDDDAGIEPSGSTNFPPSASVTYDFDENDEFVFDGSRSSPVVEESFVFRQSNSMSNFSQPLDGSGPSSIPRSSTFGDLGNLPQSAAGDRSPSIRRSASLHGEASSTPSSLRVGLSGMPAVEAYDPLHTSSEPSFGLSGMPPIEAYEQAAQTMTVDEIRHSYPPQFRNNQQFGSTSFENTRSHRQRRRQQRTDSTLRGHRGESSRGYREPTAYDLGDSMSSRHERGGRNNTNKYNNGTTTSPQGEHTPFAFEQAPWTIREVRPEEPGRRPASSTNTMRDAGISAPRASQIWEQRTSHDGGYNHSSLNSSLSSSSHGSVSDFVSACTHSSAGERSAAPSGPRYSSPIVEEYDSSDANGANDSEPEDIGPLARTDDLHEEVPDQFVDLGYAPASSEWSHPCGPFCGEFCSHEYHLADREIREVTSEEERAIENARSGQPQATGGDSSPSRTARVSEGM